MTIASDLFRTVTIKINDISQQLPFDSYSKLLTRF